MAERRNNKLEVKLQLMQNKELEQLSGFAASFQRSVADLGLAMSKYTERIESIVLNAGQTVGLTSSPTGTVAGSFTHAGDGEAKKRGDQFNAARAAGNASQTVTGANESSKGSTLDDEVFLSTLMSNPLRAFTAQPMTAQAIKWASNILPSSSNPQSRRGRATDWVRRNPQAVAAGLTTLGGAYLASNMSSSGYTGFAHQTGMETGANTLGGFGSMLGLNLLTEGGYQAFRARTSDRLASLSPAWSQQQGLELRQTLTSMGMREDPDDTMRRMMQQGHSASSVKAFFDHARRYRPDQVSSVEDSMRGLAEAASAAGMSVEEFSSATAQAAASMSRQLGIGAREGANIATVGSAYGLTPEQSASMMSRQNVLMSMGMGTAGGGTMGQRFYRASGSLSANVNSTKAIARQIIPGIENYKALSEAADKGDLRAQDQVGMIRMIASSPGVSEMLGGLSPDELGNLFDSGKEGAARMKESYMSMLKIDPGFIDSKSKVRDLLRQDGKLGKKDKELLSDFRNMDTDERRRKIDDIVAGAGGVKDSSGGMMLDLTPEAKRLVKIMSGGKDTGRPTTSADNMARWAIEPNRYIGGN